MAAGSNIEACSAATSAAWKFRWLDQVLLDPATSGLAFQIAYAIAHLPGDAGKHRFASQGWFTRVLGKCDGADPSRQVRRGFAQLVKGGHLAMQAGVGRRAVNHYTPIMSDRFAWPARANADTDVCIVPETRTAMSGDPGHPCPVGADTDVRQNTYDEAIQLTSGLEFETFWQACPKKVGKKDAAAAFERVVGAGDATVEQLVAGMAAYGDQVRSEGTAPKFIKGPAGWLLGARWDDGEKRGAASSLSALPTWLGPAHIFADVVRHHEKKFGELVSRYCGYRDLPTRAITTSRPHVADMLRSELRDLLARHGLEVVCAAQVAA